VGADYVVHALSLATAPGVLESRPCTRVTVLERDEATGTAQSARNYGVLDADIYYPSGVHEG
jgi:L-2-hydroxyglutarate oxidase LhgO